MLAPRARVVLLEREAMPGYHTTGRSAALYAPSYGPPAIRALTRASAGFFATPPPGFAGHPILTPRGALFIARADQIPALEALEDAQGGALARVDPQASHPLLRPGYAAAALFDAAAQDIDVAALHQGYLVAFRAAGGVLRTGAGVEVLSPDGGGWRVAWAGGGIRAGIIVNAAGAWADILATLAGVPTVGLVPRRRTAAIVDAPADPARWPMAIDVEERFYLKPDAGRLLLSPADETPSPPCDAQAEEIDVAEGVDRIETAFALSVRRIRHRWAGLRSFVADRTPVAGFAPGAPGFFWLAGQGGYGIQSAPALARAAAALVLGEPLPDDIAAEGVTPAALSPARPQVSAAASVRPAMAGDRAEG